MVLFRLVRLIRKARARKGMSFVFVGALLALALAGNAACFYVFDGAADHSITIEDALWYSAVSITTIGYGDLSASTPGARVGTIVFIMLLGLGAFSVFLGILIDSTTTLLTAAKKGLGKAMARNHVLIVHFPHLRRVRQIIDEIRADPEYAKREIVLVNNQIDELPFQMENVLFIRGSTLDHETFLRAGIHEAKLAIVLGHDYGDPDSDAVVAAAASVIDGLKPEIHLVAECLDDRHLSLFDAVRCDSVISGMTISGNLLVQEAHDPGVAQAIAMITSNRAETTLFSAQVTWSIDTNYATLARNLLDDHVNLLAVNRGAKSHTRLEDLSPEAGDVLVYVAEQRFRWPELLARAGLG